MLPGYAFENGVTYTLKYIQKLYPDGNEIMTKKFKVVEKNGIPGKIIVEAVEGINAGGNKYIKMDDILEATPVVQGGRRRRLRKSRKAKRKTARKSRRTSRK